MQILDNSCTTLRAIGKDENWFHKWIIEKPSRLGLGDLVIKNAELVHYQNRGGRLDLIGVIRDVKQGVERMLMKYIEGTLRRAKYEILSDDGSFYGEIPGFDGVYANADTLEECRQELEEVLEEWILFRVSRNLPLPRIDGIELAIKEVA